VKATVGLLALILFFLVLSACGSKVSSVGEDNCYKIDGEEVVYTCNNETNTSSGNTTPGYDGPNNPKALNLYRPGRFENINSPVW